MNRTSLAGFILNTMCYRESGTWELSLLWESILSTTLLRSTLIFVIAKTWLNTSYTREEVSSSSTPFSVSETDQAWYSARCIEISRRERTAVGRLLSEQRRISPHTLVPWNAPAYCFSNSSAVGWEGCRGRATLSSDGSALVVPVSIHGALLWAPHFPFMACFFIDAKLYVEGLYLFYF